VLLPCTLIGGTELDQAYCDGLTDAIAAKLGALAISHALQTTIAARGSRAGGDRDRRAPSVRRNARAARHAPPQGTTLRVNYDLIDPATLRQLGEYADGGVERSIRDSGPRGAMGRRRAAPS
jgi:hypothetical protein